MVTVGQLRAVRATPSRLPASCAHSFERLDARWCQRKALGRCDESAPARRAHDASLRNDLSIGLGRASVT